MALSFGNTGNAMLGGAAGAGGLNTGPDLETIQTEALGFLAIAGDAKVRLTTPWSSLPSSSAALLSIASRKGLVAAAGPDQIILASTESVRKAFEAPKDGDSDVRSFEPQLKIPMPMRVSQLAFTADENYLILSAETGGGLAVYEVQSLLQGSTNSAFELSTNGESLRSLIPNPTPEKSELCAIVTSSGNLHMANLKERQISNTLKTHVSSIGWSSKGKQLCAGLVNGTIHQMTPEGEVKGEIPKPPDVPEYHVSSLTWLENNLWLSIHSSNDESPPTSIYHIITRQPPAAFTFQKVVDPVEPFGAEKTPHYSILRLRDFPPALQDLLIVSSTATTEMGVLSRSKKPLATDKPAESITGVFTTTEFLDDAKRPTLPMTDSMDDSTAVGIALDLSSKDKVYKPIPSDVELEESPGPLPGFWVLTHEGVLCAWWVVYDDSIKQGVTYPGITSLSEAGPTAPVASATAFSKPSGPTFGSPAPVAPAFGSSAQLGQKSSPWGGASSAATPANSGGPTFGSSSFGNSPAASAPTFGKPSGLGFGQSSQLGAKVSPWGAPPPTGAGAGSGPAFGQSGFSGFANTTQSPFGASKPASAAPATGGFAGFSGSSGFASMANNSGSSIFGGGNKASPSPFTTSSSMDTAFPASQEKPSGSVFGSAPFKLESSFKPDPSAKENNEKAGPKSGSSLFGNAFGSALTDAANKPPTPAAKGEDMDTTDPVEQTPQQKPTSSLFPPRSSPESTTPTSTPAPSKFMFPTSPAPVTSVFGQASKPPPSGGIFGSKTETSKPTGLFGSQQSTPRAGGIFGSKTDTPKSTGFPSLFGTNSGAGNSWMEAGTPPKAKVEEEAPLPPDTTSRLAYPLGDSSSSSASSNASSQPLGATTTPVKQGSLLSTPQTARQVTDAPLPPDFTKTASKPMDAPLPPDFVRVSKPADNSKSVEDAPLPPDFTKVTRTAIPDAPLPPDPTSLKSTEFAAPKVPFKESSFVPSVPESDDDDSGLEGSEEEEGSEEGSEGSGVDVAKDLSPSVTGLTPTPGFTPQSSFGGLSGTLPANMSARPLFGEISRNAPVFPRPTATSPRSPSPVRGAIPNRVIRNDSLRSVSAPGMASQILGPRASQSQLGATIASRDRGGLSEDPFMAQHRKLKARQEAAETQPLIDEEDDEVQKILASEVDGSLILDEFIAHSNVAPPAQESIPSQVEAVYRDINSMIDTLGLNARTVKSFIKGHTENRAEDGRNMEDLEDPDGWVLCEIDDLGGVIDGDLSPELAFGRVRDLDDKLDACQELARDMHRLRAKQEDLKKIVMMRMDPEQADMTRSLPLSAEQATQQKELRREFANFSKLLAEAEEALTILKTRIASVSSASGRSNSNVPTVEAVIRTITKMTAMVEKRSGDIDVLENQLRKVRLGSTDPEASPRTPQARRSIMFSPDSTPARTLRQSMGGSVMSLSASVRATPPRKKLSGFSKEEKGVLMEKRARRQAVLEKLKTNVEKRGVSVWNMEDIE